MAKRKTARKPTLLDKLMAEYICPGNLLWTRHTYYQHLTDGLTAKEKHERFYAIDYAVFSPPAMTPEEVQAMRAYWGEYDTEGFWNRTGEVPTVPLD